MLDVHTKIPFEKYLSGNYLRKALGTILEPIDLPKADTAFSRSCQFVAYGLELEERVEGGVEYISSYFLAGKLHDCIDSVLEALRDGTWADEGRRKKHCLAVQYQCLNRKS